MCLCIEKTVLHINFLQLEDPRVQKDFLQSPVARPANLFTSSLFPVAGEGQPLPPRDNRVGGALVEKEIGPIHILCCIF